MKKYYLTIINIDINTGTHTQFNVVKTETDFEECIEKELGGWKNVRGITTTSNGSHSDEYIQSGWTKNRKKAFSIICLMEFEKEKKSKVYTPAKESKADIEFLNELVAPLNHPLEFLREKAVETTRPLTFADAEYLQQTGYKVKVKNSVIIISK